MAVNATAAVIVFYYSPTWIFPLLLVLGGLVTYIVGRTDNSTAEVEDIQSFGIGRWFGSGLIFTWALLLVISTAVREGTSYESHKVFHWWESFYRIGSLIFGGGQVKSGTARLFGITYRPVWLQQVWPGVLLWVPDC